MTLENGQIVSIVRCKRYHLDSIRSSLNQLLEPWDGIGSFIKPKQKVLLKPNLLAAAKPAEAVTTHPVIMRVMTELVQDAGGQVFIGDSPGRDNAKHAYLETGMQAVAEETGAQLIKFDQFRQKDYDGIRKRKLELAAALDQVDLVINMAKLKTHPLTGLTGAVKNVYGCIVGAKKGKMHFEYPLPADFAGLLIDVFLAVKPAFSIIDAVIAMEGNGPRRGKPRNAGLIMASPNAFALDCVAAAVAGFKPEQVTTLQAAKKQSLPGTDISEIEIRGLTIEESFIDDFDPGIAASGKLGRLVTHFPLAWVRGLKDRSRPYPRINEELCNSCGICVEGCPAQIICLGNDIPDIELDSCIRCYCCREFCPQGAVDLK